MPEQHMIIDNGSRAFKNETLFCDELVKTSAPKTPVSDRSCDPISEERWTDPAKLTIMKKTVNKTLLCRN